MTSLNPNSKLSKALALHPDVLPYIISLNPHDFERLTNPLMQKLMPPRITLIRLATMVNLPVDELIKSIYAAAHVDTSLPNSIETQHDTLPRNPTRPPEWTFQEVICVVDLLEGDERLDIDPFVPLFPALKRVEVGDVLLMKHKWEPQPLYDVWLKLGIDYYSVQKSPDEWWIYLRKTRESYRKV
ncbi:MAG: DUF1858 domain-containing protein [Chloroflexi bacterium]|nr:DUF1858 domain-containing protein [Chloroflexota bacterium]